MNFSFQTNLPKHSLSSCPGIHCFPIFPQSQILDPSKLFRVLSIGHQRETMKMRLPSSDVHIASYFGLLRRPGSQRRVRPEQSNPPISESNLAAVRKRKSGRPTRWVPCSSTGTQESGRARRRGLCRLPGAPSYGMGEKTPGANLSERLRDVGHQMKILGDLDKAKGHGSFLRVRQTQPRSKSIGLGAASRRSRQIGVELGQPTRSALTRTKESTRILPTSRSTVTASYNFPIRTSLDGISVNSMGKRQDVGIR